MGYHAFLEESKHHHLQNKKTVQNHILFYRLFERVLPKFVLEKMLTHPESRKHPTPTQDT
jgi:hypothetical protein